MEPEHWDKIAVIYGQACELSPAARGSFLARACGGNEDVLREIEDLLHQDVTRDGLLERVTAESAQEAERRSAAQKIGPYRILREIGQGAMGTVYEAEQDHPRRSVALKVIRRDRMHPDLVRRFERELEALGRLQHPGIARIYDAGSADVGFGPQPYFAMELIAGLPLADYCTSSGLTTRKRLEVMAKVAHALQHAHDRGIIHRDLKPGNILVDENGQPKILDFGVARFTDVDGQATQAGNVLGTLAYMSPEQVLAGDQLPDERTDVYSLGVMMFELLAGRRPYEVTGSVPDATRTIVEREPEKLSSVDRAFRGDLSVIADKAMEKNVTRRYKSAAAFAEDIERHLANEPMLSRPPGTLYQLGKFSRRHQAVVGAVAAVFAVLTVGIAATTQAALRAARAEKIALAERDRAVRAGAEATGERNRAETERNRAINQSNRADAEAATAKAVNEFLTNDVLFQASARRQSQSGAKPDPDLKVSTALERAAAGLDGKFGGEPRVEGSIRHTIGATYRDLGFYKEASLQLERALGLFLKIPGSEAVEGVQAANDLALVYMEQARFAEAEVLLKRMLAIRNRDGRKADRLTLMTMNDLALAEAGRTGDHARAERMHRQVLDEYVRNFGYNDPDTLAVMNNLATEYTNQGKYSEAAELYVKVVAAKKHVLGAEHPSTLISLNSLGVVYRNLGQFAKARRVFAEALAARQRFLGADHPDTISSRAGLGRLLMAEGRYAEAEPALREVMESSNRILGAEHPSSLSNAEGLADLFVRTGRHADAAVLYRQVLAVRRKTQGPSHFSASAWPYSVDEWKVPRCLLRP